MYIYFVSVVTDAAAQEKERGMFEDEPEEGRGTVNPDLGATLFHSQGICTAPRKGTG
jgi:hypothetical protein